MRTLFKNRSGCRSKRVAAERQWNGIWNGTFRPEQTGTTHDQAFVYKPLKAERLRSESQNRPSPFLSPRFFRNGGGVEHRNGTNGKAIKWTS